MTLPAVIEKRSIRKPYLGGWRHKVTGTEYVNATSQTGPLPKRILQENTCSRAVQFVQTKDGVAQSLCHRATQMWRKDCYIPNITDKYMTLKPYETYDEIKLRLDNNARIIQRNYRAYKWMKYIRECAQVYRNMLERCNKYEEEKAVIYKIRHKENILRQIHPRSTADFDMLYNLIEKWRSDRLNDIKLRLFKSAQRAENYRILEKTVDMFNHIDRHKQAIKSSYKKRMSSRFLTMNCKPIRWHGYKGKPVEMITTKIQKAREFKELYYALSNNHAKREERIKLLLVLSKSLEVHNCIQALDLSSLLDQQIVLLIRDIKDISFYYLNERIIHSYLDFVRVYSICGCEITDGNSKYDELREPLVPKTKICRNCLKLLPYHRFLSHSTTKKLSTCISCSSLALRNIAHVDYDPYMFILNCVRDNEKRRKCNSVLAFMMQKQDIYHLINHIWQARSAVSKIDDLFLLRMVRYQRDVEWSPWNCILLTEDEADIHFHIDDATTIYSKHLINQITLAHQIAKNYFKQLIIYERDFRESCRFDTIQNKNSTDYS